MNTNNFKELLRTKTGVELSKWIEENKHKLYNQRIFYVVKANLEQKDTYKIGISEKSGNGAYQRLKDYFHYYGTTTKTNPCKGVKLYLVLANTFNPDVSSANSKIRKLETLLKRNFKDFRERGDERINININDLFRNLEKVDLITETEKPIRQSSRLLEQGSLDTIHKIVGKTILKDKSVKYTVEFKNVVLLDKNEASSRAKLKNKSLTYDELIGFRNGKRLADEYEATYKPYNLRR